MARLAPFSSYIYYMKELESGHTSDDDTSLVNTHVVANISPCELGMSDQSRNTHQAWAIARYNHYYAIRAVSLFIHGLRPITQQCFLGILF